MKTFLLLATVFLITSCTQNSTTPSQTGSPYPSVPMSIGTGDTAGQPITTVNPGINTTAGSWSARGTEPFWNVEVTPTTAILSRPGEKDVISTKYDIEQSDKGSIISIKSPKGDFFLTLMKGSCSDGMSETKYAYSATANAGTEELKGCANKK